MKMRPMRHSRALAEVGFDEGTRTLRVRFRHGGAYDYLDVPPEVFEGLIAADHPWTEWRERVLEHEYCRRD